MTSPPPVNPATPASPARAIDLNCDMGERTDRAGRDHDIALLGVVSSANIACGAHAGDADTMREIVAAALARGVAIGAHPGYPDRANFGRVALHLPANAVRESVESQVREVARVGQAAGGALRHLKPHGALYHAASERPEVARAIGEAAASVDPGLVLVGLAGSAALDAWRAMGLATASEAFADRRYERSSALRARGHDDAVITDPAEAAEQATRIARGEPVTACDGGEIAIRAETICIHSDTAGSVAIALAVSRALEAAGVRIAPLAR